MRLRGENLRILFPEVRSGQRGILSAVSTESDVLAVDPELTSALPDSHGSKSKAFVPVIAARPLH